MRSFTSLMIGVLCFGLGLIHNPDVAHAASITTSAATSASSIHNVQLHGAEYYDKEVDMSKKEDDSSSKKDDYYYGGYKYWYPPHPKKGQKGSKGSKG